MGHWLAHPAVAAALHVKAGLYPGTYATHTAHGLWIEIEIDQ